MPTYSYRCTTCEHAFDIAQEFSDESLTVCPSCQGALRKVFAAIGVTFQGSGFYRTDSRAEAKGKSGAQSSTLPAAPAGGGPTPAPAKESAKKETPKKAATPTTS